MVSTHICTASMENSLPQHCEIPNPDFISIPSKEKQPAVQEFQTPEDCDVLSITFAARFADFLCGEKLDESITKAIFRLDTARTVMEFNPMIETFKDSGMQNSRPQHCNSPTLDFANRTGAAQEPSAEHQRAEHAAEAFQTTEDCDIFDDSTLKALEDLVCGEECDKPVAALHPKLQNFPSRDNMGAQKRAKKRKHLACGRPRHTMLTSSVQTNTCLPAQKRSRSDDNAGAANVKVSVYAQCADCKTKNAATKERHEDICTNILATPPNNKYYKQLNIIALDKHQNQFQLQTVCHCGRTRRFVQRRAVVRGVPITYFAADRCICEPKNTDKLRVCFCGALFRSTASLYACPCFGATGPAFAGFPDYARFAPRLCPCPHKRRHCVCLLPDA